MGAVMRCRSAAVLRAGLWIALAFAVHCDAKRVAADDVAGEWNCFGWNFSVNPAHGSLAFASNAVVTATDSVFNMESNLTDDGIGETAPKAKSSAVGILDSDSMSFGWIYSSDSDVVQGMGEYWIDDDGDLSGFWMQFGTLRRGFELLTKQSGPVVFKDIPKLYQETKKRYEGSDEIVGRWEVSGWNSGYDASSTPSYSGIGEIRRKDKIYEAHWSIPTEYKGFGFFNKKGNLVGGWGSGSSIGSIQYKFDGNNILEGNWTTQSGGAPGFERWVKVEQGPGPAQESQQLQDDGQVEGPGSEGDLTDELSVEAPKTKNKPKKEAENGDADDEESKDDDSDGELSPLQSLRQKLKRLAKSDP